MKILIPVKLYQKLRAYVDNTKYEISGFGKIKQIDQDFLVTDLRIFRQTVSPANTIIKAQELGRFFDEIIQEEGTLENWKLWWHSHAKMETFWSLTDVTTIEDFDSEMPNDNWILSLETNHNEDYLARLDIFSPIRLTKSDIDVEILFYDRNIKLNSIDEIAENVTVVSSPSTKIKRKQSLLPNDWEAGGSNIETGELPSLAEVMRETSDTIPLPQTVIIRK